MLQADSGFRSYDKVRSFTANLPNPVLAQMNIFWESMKWYWSISGPLVASIITATKSCIAAPSLGVFLGATTVQVFSYLRIICWFLFHSIFINKVVDIRIVFICNITPMSSCAASNKWWFWLPPSSIKPLPAPFPIRRCLQKFRFASNNLWYRTEFKAVLH